MTRDEIERLRRLELQATTQPWERFGYIGENGLCRIHAVVDQDRTGRDVTVAIPASQEDAALIAEMRNKLVSLLDAAEQRDELLAACKPIARMLRYFSIELAGQDEAPLNLHDPDSATVADLRKLCVVIARAKGNQ